MDKLIAISRLCASALLLAAALLLVWRATSETICMPAGVYMQRDTCLINGKWVELEDYI